MRGRGSSRGAPKSAGGRRHRANHQGMLLVVSGRGGGGWVAVGRGAGRRGKRGLLPEHVANVQAVALTVIVGCVQLVLQMGVLVAACQEPSQRHHGAGQGQQHPCPRLAKVLLRVDSIDCVVCRGCRAVGEMGMRVFVKTPMPH